MKLLVAESTPSGFAVHVAERLRAAGHTVVEDVAELDGCDAIVCARPLTPHGYMAAGFAYGLNTTVIVVSPTGPAEMKDLLDRPEDCVRTVDELVTAWADGAEAVAS